MNYLHLIDKAFLLKKTNLFSSLDLDLLLIISDNMERVNYKKMQKIFQVGQEAHRIYLIVEGVVTIQNKSGGVVAQLYDGEFFGDESIFNNRPRSYIATSTTSSTLLAISRAHMLGIIEERPSVAVALLEMYSKGIDFRERMRDEG